MPGFKPPMDLIMAKILWDLRCKSHCLKRGQQYDLLTARILVKMLAKGLDTGGTVTGMFLGRVDKLNTNYLNDPILDLDRKMKYYNLY